MVSGPVYVSMGLGTRQILNILCIYAIFLHNLGNWLMRVDREKAAASQRLEVLPIIPASMPLCKILTGGCIFMNQKLFRTRMNISGKFALHKC